MRCLGCALAAVIVIALAVVGVAAYMGFVPLLSGVIGANKPKDLNVPYTQKDYESVVGKAQVQITQPEYICVGCEVETSGRQPVDATFTEAEVTALLNAQNQKYGELKNIQVKFNADGTVELTGLISRNAGVPIYLKAIPKVAPGGKLDLTVESVEIARMPVPASMLSQYTGGVDVSDGMHEISDAMLKQAGILELTDLKVSAGQIYFKGVVPKTIKGVAPPPGAGASVK